MPKIRMTVDDYNNSNFTPVPEGEYVCYVYNVEPKTFRTGSEGFSITYNIGEGPHQGRKIFDNIVLTENARWKLAQFWKAMTNEQAPEIDTDELKNFVGRKVIVRVGIDQSRNQNVVRGLKYVEGEHKRETADLNSYLENREPVGVTANNDLPDDQYPF
mgnify:CR=1 FL=1